jgi:hypothetical protein
MILGDSAQGAREQAVQAQEVLAREVLAQEVLGPVEVALSIQTSSLMEAVHLEVSIQIL